MAGREDSADRLMTLALDRSVAGRRRLAAAMGDLLGDGREILSDRELALMADILAKLLGAFETALRAELAARLAEQPDAPQELLTALAKDDIEVARPILTKSGLLRDRALIEVIQHRTLEHQLAIAMRTPAGEAPGETPGETVSEAVSGALVETGSGDVIKALLENAGAQIGEATMAYLVEEAQRVDSYQEPLLQRRDLSEALARRLAWSVAAALRRQILDDHEIEPADLDDDLEQAVRALAGEAAPGKPAASPAEALAERIEDAQELTGELMARVLAEGEVALFEALFGRAAGLAAPRLQRVLYEPGGGDLAVACRALGLGKEGYRQLLLLVRQARPGREALTRKAVTKLAAEFDKLDPGEAQAVLRQWQRDPDHLDAIAALEESRAPPKRR